MQMIQFENYLLKNCQTEPGQRIVIGVSGGADSICLMDLLQKAGNPLLVVHFNHHLRPESGADSEFVRQMAQSRGLEFIQGEGDVRNYAKKLHKTLEEAARICRYEFLFGQAREKNVDAVAVGHTADDQVETILMHILRGCGLDGLQGMLPLTKTTFCPEIKLIRPLLTFWKKEILEYCKLNDLAYIEDSSNKDPQYFRNRLRHELIPTLKKYNLNVEKHFINLGEIARRDLDLLNQTVLNEYQNCLIEESTDYLALSISKLNGIGDNLTRSVLHQAFRKLSKSTSEIGFDHLEKMMAYIRHPDLKSPLPVISKYEMLVEGDSLFIYRQEAKLPYHNWPHMDRSQVITFNYPGSVTINNDWKIKTELIQNSKINFPSYSGQLIFQAYFDAEKIQEQIRIECQKPGDRFSPLGMKGGSQKLSDFWVNKKIPHRLRSTWPLIKNNTEIIWIPGFQPSFTVQVSEKSNQILKIEMLRDM
jgi:tRNA(Ile)-lysidine synthase